MTTRQHATPLGAAMQLITKKKFKRVILGQLKDTYKIDQAAGCVNLVPNDPATRLAPVPLFRSDDEAAARNEVEKFKNWINQIEQEGKVDD